MPAVSQLETAEWVEQVGSWFYSALDERPWPLSVRSQYPHSWRSQSRSVTATP